MKKSSIVTFVRLTVLSAIALGSAGMMASPASASGRSAATNGCYVQWWNTAWSATCTPASASGSYRAQVQRSWEEDYSGPWRYVGYGSHATFDSGQARHAVEGGWIEFRG